MNMLLRLVAVMATFGFISTAQAEASRMDSCPKDLAEVCDLVLFDKGLGKFGLYTPRYPGKRIAAVDALVMRFDADFSQPASRAYMDARNTYTTTEARLRGLIDQRRKDGVRIRTEEIFRPVHTMLKQTPAYCEKNKAVCTALLQTGKHVATRLGMLQKYVDAYDYPADNLLRQDIAQLIRQHDREQAAIREVLHVRTALYATFTPLYDALIIDHGEET